MVYELQAMSWTGMLHAAELDELLRLGDPEIMRDARARLAQRRGAKWFSTRRVPA